MKVSKGMAGAVKALAGLLLIVLVILGLVAMFSDSISLSVFAGFAFVSSAIVVLLTYFGLFRWRTAGAYLATAAVLLVGVSSTVYMAQPELKTDQYQAVFLTNGQVYFGHLENPEAKSPVLKNIYYLQSQPAQPASGSSSTKNQQASISLVKLGKELHGPEDAMAIKSDQILFWENLKNDSKVVQAIKQDQSKK